MPQSIDSFNDTARVGRKVLNTLSPDLKLKYLDGMARIYGLLRDIHDLVIDVAIRAANATDLDQAKRALQGINEDALEGTFRARNWCNRMERLGKSIRPLTDDARLTGKDRSDWELFSTALQNREGEVAWLYYDNLAELRDLATTATSLEALKTSVESISEELVTQKAQFDFLAKKAEAERDRLELAP